MAVSDELYGVLSPSLAAADLVLVDVEVLPGLVRVTVERDGGVDLDALAAANRVVSAVLDEHDPMPGRYTLEVSSPGVERRLRTPEQFARAVGETVAVRTVSGTQGPRRVQGRLAAADETGLVVEGSDVPGGSMRVDYDVVERARTVFEWGATPAPSPSRGGKGPKPGAKGGTGRAKTSTTTERVTTP